MSEKQNKRKQSLLIGALTGSFGIFISKVLGLFYVVPLNSLAGEGNMAFYSIAYTYYDLLLKISSVGIPFAIAALVAKYYARNDYKTVLLVKKLGSSILLLSGFIIAVTFLSISKPLATMAMGSMASAEDVTSLHNLFKILAVALVLVPFLSSLRGYYQGLKEMTSYAASQVLEQFVRVFNIIFLGYIFVVVLKFDSIYAIYMAMISACLGAAVAIIYFLIAKRKDDEVLKRLAAAQEGDSELTKKAIFSEMLSLGVPYLVISFLGVTSTLINSNFFMGYATSVGIPYEEAKLVLGILQVNCNKIAAIPQVLTIGFSAGLVPYITEAFERHDFEKLRKHINDILKTVLFILIPLTVWIFIYAKPIYYIMYGNANLDFAAQLFAVSCLTILTETIAPIISSTCITLRQNKQTIVSLLIGTVIKFISFFIFIRMFGSYGLILSTALASAVVIIFNLFILKANYQVHYGILLRNVLFMVIFAVISAAPLLLNMVGFGFTYDSRFLCIVILGVYGLLSLGIYIILSDYFGLLQSSLNMNLKQVTSRILNKIHK